MIKVNYYLVSYDRLYDRVIDNLDNNELETIYCYAIQKKIKKNITDKIKTINEWDLEWNDYQYQTKQYYEYGAIVHLLKNPDLIKNCTHIGLLHYDIIFNVNSLKDVETNLCNNKDMIHYQCIRPNNQLLLTKHQLNMICKFLSDKLHISIDPDYIWTNGWVSEALSVTPKEIFLKFGQFLFDNKTEIENMLINNMWGLMQTTNHRICGFVERMWGIYLMSLNMKMEKLNIIHDRDFYEHQHETEINWITN